MHTDYVVPVRGAFSGGGLAVLAWDQPGCGPSTGDWRRQTLVDRADEALAAIGVLKAHPELASERIGLWGQSQAAVACIRLIQDGNRRGDLYEQLETTALAPAQSQPWGRCFTSPPFGRQGDMAGIPGW